jgi:hypothetical protein
VAANTGCPLAGPVVIGNAAYSCQKRTRVIIVAEPYESTPGRWGAGLFALRWNVAALVVVIGVFIVGRHPIRWNHPTCVGRAALTRSSRSAEWEHPHVRGEDVTRIAITGHRGGAPPRA